MERSPLYFFEEQIAKAARRLSGGAGPMGVDAIMLKEWLLRHGAHSDALREEFGYWVYWLSNQSPPYAAYRALNAVRELAGNKKPGVRPIGCGEIFMRLFADCDHDQSKGGATVECGNTQLCAGLPSGIEANLHAVRAIWPQSAGWTHDNGVEEDERNKEDDDMPEEHRPVSVRFENPHMWILALQKMIGTRGLKRIQDSALVFLMQRMHSTS